MLLVVVVVVVAAAAAAAVIVMSFVYSAGNAHCNLGKTLKRHQADISSSCNQVCHRFFDWFLTNESFQSGGFLFVMVQVQMNHWFSNFL